MKLAAYSQTHRIAFMQGFRVHQAFRSVKEHEAELVD